jgi:hypothetical protein
MTRVLSLVCLGLVLTIGTVPAFAKPSIAILGLEVIDPSGAPTERDTQIAKDLTDGLRARARAGTGPYQLQPGSDKELIDMKLMNNCDDEKEKCMTAIGSQLKADWLLFGRIQKEGKAYQVSMRLLDIHGKSPPKSSSDLIPLADTGGAGLQTWAKKIYAKYTGESSAGGSIVVNLDNADRGTILIDGQEKGNITGGSGQVAGLPDGKYRLAVESDGFRRWDRDVTVSGGKAETINVTLEKGDGPSIGGGGGEIGGGGGGGGGDKGPEGGQSSGKGLWKGVFAGSLAVAAGGAGWWIYNWRMLEDERSKQCANGIAVNGCTPTGSAYGPDGIMNTADDYPKVASDDRASKKSTQTYVGGIVMGVGLGVAAFAFYKGFIAKSPSTESSTQTARKRGKRVRRERFIVTPIISPDGGAATLRLDW